MSEDNTEESVPRKRGRPPGSKNKPKRGRPKKTEVPQQESEVSKKVIKNNSELFEDTKAPEDKYLNDALLLEPGYNVPSEKTINANPIDESFYYRGSKNVPVAGAQYPWTGAMVEELRKCKDDIIYFAENFFQVVTLDKGKHKIELYEAQRRILRSLVERRFLACCASRQVGKSLSINTLVLTNKGWSTMGQLKDGDVVYDEQGNETTVVKAHDVMQDRVCYKIAFDNGEEIIADEDHLWYTEQLMYPEESRENIRDCSVKTTKQISDSLYRKTVGEPAHRIPAAKSPGTREDRGIRYHYITDIQKTDSVPVRCITVDSPSKLYCVGKHMIPTHNTTLLSIFALWMVCFNSDYRLAIVANKEATAINIFKRVRMAYEQLPNYIKPGVKDYAKTGLTLGNDSSILISTTTTTSIRGDTLNCVSGDAVVTHKSEDGKIEPITLEMLEKRISGGETLGQILTHFGWSSFRGVRKITAEREGVHITTKGGRGLTVTSDHLVFYSDTESKPAEEFRIGDQVQTENGKDKVTNVEIVPAVLNNWYDVIETEDHTFLANSFKIHNCVCLDEAAYIDCLSGETEINIRNRITREEKRTSIGQLYMMLSKSTNTR